MGGVGIALETHKQRFEEVTDRILEWHEKRLEPLRKVWEKYTKLKVDKSVSVFYLQSEREKDLWQAIHKTLGENK